MLPGGTGIITGFTLSFTSRGTSPIVNTGGVIGTDGITAGTDTGIATGTGTVSMACGIVIVTDGDAEATDTSGRRGPGVY